MTDGASSFLNYLKAEYRGAGFPDIKSFAFSPDGEDHKRVFAELKGMQLIRPVTDELWLLTERGAGQLLAELPTSEGASALWGKLKAAYVQAGRPKRRAWTLTPADPAEEAAYSELRARGYVEQLTAELFILSAMGMNRSAG